MPLEIGRVVSVFIALTSLAVAYWFHSAGVFHITVIVIVIPLGCIWYGKEIGSFTEVADDGGFNPLGSLISLTGWILLTALLLILVWLSIQA